MDLSPYERKRAFEWVKVRTTIPYDIVHVKEHRGLKGLGFEDNDLPEVT
jgi:hypothetical protein